MARPFSIDLRERVVDAVVRDGQSCRQAAARFGVGVIEHGDRLGSAVPETGGVAPGQMGHPPKKLIGPWRTRCWSGAGGGLHAARLVAELAERGMQVDYRTVWEFVHAEGLTYKKRR